MPLIEGVGDEVTQFFILVICGVVALLAWWSTGVRQYRFRTVVIMERSVRRLYRFIPGHTIDRARNQPAVTNTPLIRNINAEAVPLNDSDDASEDDTVISEASISRQDTVESIISDDNFADISFPDSSNAEHNLEYGDNQPADNLPDASSQDLEMNSIVSAMDSDSSILRNRRLAFFQNRSESVPDSTSSNVNEPHREVNTKKTESNKTQSKEDEKSATPCVNNAQETTSPSEEIRIDTENQNNTAKESEMSDNIRIGLKYLNDDLKMVEGSLQEPLGEFKRRHFRGELGARKLVRLIFNGQVLQREGATLASCGLFDNCVVHCLVHQPRTPHQYIQVQQQLNPVVATPESTNNNLLNDIQHRDQGIQLDGEGQEDRDWDLSHILLTMLASILSIAWYCHIRFSSLFGMAASLAMLGLTALYFIAVICVYFPDTQPTHNVSTPNTPGQNETAETNNIN